MKKKIINNFFLTISSLLFVTGIVCISLYYFSTKYYNNAHTRNYLPPAGSFIKGKNTFSFAIMGDSGLRNEPLKLIFKDIINNNYAFIINVGDQAKKIMTSNFELLLQTINNDIGNFPYYSVPGNHDVLYRGEKFIKPENYLRFYNRAFGQAYYWFSYGNTLFIGLDSSKGNIYPDQKEWLISTLEHLRKSFKSCIVFMHIPPIDPRPGKKYCMGYSESERLKQIFEKYKITAIIAGHIHEYHSLKFGNIPLYIAPPSGQKFRGKQKYFGYLGCSILKDGSLTVKNISVTNKTGSNHIGYFLSTKVQKINIFAIGIICLILSWLSLFFSRFQNKQ